MQKNCKSVTKWFSNLLWWGANLLHIGTKQMQLIFLTSNQLQKNCYFYTFWICKNVAIHSKKRMNKKNAWIQIVLIGTPIHGVIKIHFKLLPKLTLKVHITYPYNAFHEILLEFFQISRDLLFLIDFQIICFHFCWNLIYFHKHITGNDESDKVPNQNRAKITGK